MKTETSTFLLTLEKKCLAGAKECYVDSFTFLWNLVKSISHLMSYGPINPKTFMCYPRIYPLNTQHPLFLSFDF